MSRLSVLVVVVAAGCAPPNAPASSPATPPGDGAALPPVSSSGQLSDPARAGVGVGGAPSAASSPEPAPTVPSAPPPGTPTLPAISVKTVGLHVGGGPNDADTKAPFLTAIEGRFPEFLRCYRLVSEPGKGGSFGVDLHIEREGGHARVEQPRAALAGDAFRDCMVSAFSGVAFPQLKKASVVSYSLRFVVDP